MNVVKHLTRSFLQKHLICLSGCWIRVCILKCRAITLKKVQVASAVSLRCSFKHSKFLEYSKNFRRSSRSQMLLKVGVLENFTNSTEKDLCWSIWRTATLLETQVFACEIYNIFTSTSFYRAPPVAASVILVKLHLQRYCNNSLLEVIPSGFARV